MAYYGYGFPEYESVAEKRSRAQRVVEKLRKKNPGIAPVIIQGRKLVKTWWGKAWNDNLESYADYANRITRGQSYVRHGAVLDLQIEQGVIKALVQGSSSKPYNVDLRIRPLKTGVWKNIQSSCAGKIESLQELLGGNFPKDLAELFTAKGSGLFPAPKEIALSCSCPDWAVMCKHVAAALYGVGVRLDEDPALFFTLRGIKIEELVSEVIQEKTRTILVKAEAKSRRVLEDADVSALFGVDVEADNKKEKTGGRRRRLDS